MGIPVSKIILFGSHASGTAKKHSDIDLVVVSNYFRNVNLLERLGLLGRARIAPTDIKEPMDILGFTEEEFAVEGKGSFLGREIKLKGIVVEF
ncbi:MAG: nucleotidyltransferase domain-containing protein [Candidatus Eremiobacteraeota bacterium]|nr:nucleotidyltransferase domain-containing protein [Candidatus Eremiobacteraeota bacterium]